MNILEKLQEIFRDIFDDENLVITKETTAKDIEEWDSLAHINLVLAIREEFNVEFTLEEVSEYKNVGDIVNSIEKRIEK
jgi:acyl carrier protein